MEDIDIASNTKLKKITEIIRQKLIAKNYVRD